jgi:hypothetical protein
MRRPLLMAVAIVALVAVTSACRAEVNVLLDVEAEGAGTVTAEVGLDDELLELMEEFAGGPDELLDQLPEGMDAETRREEDMTFYSVTEPFDDPDDLLQRAGALEGFETTFEQFDLVVEDGAATLDATIATADASEALDGLGGLGGLQDIGEDILSSSLVVALPGEVVETNADETLSDGRLRWDIPLLGGSVDVMAVTESGGGGLPFVVIALVLAVVVAGAAWWLSRRKRQDAAAAVAATPAPSAPTAIFDGDSDAAASGNDPEA